MNRSIQLPDQLTPEQQKGILDFFSNLFSPSSAPQEASPVEGGVAALCIGLNSVNPNCYGGWDGRLTACENDAKAMYHEIAMPTVRPAPLDDYRTKMGVSWFITAMNTMSSSTAQHCVISYSGHGGQAADTNGDEDDGQDETLCLTNGQLADDKLWDMLCDFPEGKTVYLFFDCCHSGTAVRSNSAAFIARRMPMNVSAVVYLKNPSLGSREPKADIIMLSACQDNQYSLDGGKHGAFTQALLDAVRMDRPQTWNLLRKKVASRSPVTQSPQLRAYGPNASTILNTKPFFIR